MNADALASDTNLAWGVFLLVIPPLAYLSSAHLPGWKKHVPGAFCLLASILMAQLPYSSPQAPMVIVVLATLLVRVLVIIPFRKPQTPAARRVTAASAFWVIATLAWGLVFDWSERFRFGEYVGLILLPPTLAVVALFLWRWSR